MPRFAFLGSEQVKQLTAYEQSLGAKGADYRVARQDYWKRLAVSNYAKGYAANADWLHSLVPPTWLYMPNPYPAEEAGVARGQEIYQFYCIGCHGPVGDGQGPAAPYLQPVPFDFTGLKEHLPGGKYVGGLIYYQVMNGITGTAMPYFKKDLESGKIWDVSNYVAQNFIGYTDYQVPPFGLDASYITPPRPTLPYQPPAGQTGVAR